MEVDALETLIDSRCEPSLANLLNANLVVQGAELVEFTEKRVELKERARVASPSAPERAASKRTVLSLEFIDDLVEVPGEGQDVGVLLLRELSINSESGIFRGDINFTSLLLSLGNDCSVRESAHVRLHKTLSRAHLALSHQGHVKSLIHVGHAIDGVVA